MLAVGAENRAALPQSHFLQRGVAARTALAAATIDQQLLGEIAGLAVTADKVAQGGTAALDGLPQHLFDLSYQPLTFLRCQGQTGAQRVNARAEQGLIGVDIADAHNEMVVHDGGFDGLLALAEAVEQVVGAEVTL